LSHRLLYDDSEEGRCLSFHSTRIGARARFFEAQKRFPKRVSNCEILPIEFQPSKVEFLKFLAKYCPAHDNG
jgi:hypothetical protein